MLSWGVRRAKVPADLCLHALMAMEQDFLAAICNMSWRRLLALLEVTWKSKNLGGY